MFNTSIEALFIIAVIAVVVFCHAITVVLAKLIDQIDEFRNKRSGTCGFQFQLVEFIVSISLFLYVAMAFYLNFMKK